ncbi:unnamed protein product [Symbiodinium sp. KB8]|nr:unnamed protein product [Symbiodinium sp. KB8]
MGKNQPWGGRGSYPPYQSWRIWPGARSPAQKLWAADQNWGSQSEWDQNTHLAFDAQPAQISRSGRELAQAETATDGQVDGLLMLNNLQSRLNQARKAENRLARACSQRENTKVQWENFQEKLKQNYLKEKKRFGLAMQEADKEVIDAKENQEAARAMVRQAFAEQEHGPLNTDTSMAAAEWDQMHTDWEQESRANLDGVLQRAMTSGARPERSAPAGPAIVTPHRGRGAMPRSPPTVAKDAGPPENPRPSERKPPEPYYDAATFGGMPGMSPDAADKEPLQSATTKPEPAPAPSKRESKNSRGSPSGSIKEASKTPPPSTHPDKSTNLADKLDHVRRRAMEPFGGASHTGPPPPVTTAAPEVQHQAAVDMELDGSQDVLITRQAVPRHLKYHGALVRESLVRAADLLCDAFEGALDAIVPLVPQRMDGSAYFIAYPKILDASGSSGVAVIFDLSRVGGHFFAAIVSRVLTDGDITHFIRPLTHGHVEEFGIYIGESMTPLSEGEHAVLFHGTVITVLASHIAPSRPTRIDALFEPGAERTPLQHVLRTLQTPDLCVLFEGRRYVVRQDYHVGRTIQQAIGAVLDRPPDDLTLCSSFCFGNLDVQGHVCDRIVAVAALPAPSNLPAGLVRRDVWTFCDYRPLGLKPKAHLSHVHRVHIPSILALDGVILPPEFDLLIEGGTVLGDEVQVGLNSTLIFRAKPLLTSSPEILGPDEPSEPDDLDEGDNSDPDDNDAPGRGPPAEGPPSQPSIECRHSGSDGTADISRSRSPLRHDISVPSQVARTEVCLRTPTPSRQDMRPLSPQGLSGVALLESGPIQPLSAKQPDLTGDRVHFVDSDSVDAQLPRLHHMLHAPERRDGPLVPVDPEEVLNVLVGLRQDPPELLTELLFLVYAPYRVPETYVLPLELPCSIQHALHAVAECRDTELSARYPEMFVVEPQPSRVFAALITAPAWAAEEAIVLLDCRALNNSIFCMPCSSRINRESLCALAGLPSHLNTQVFVYGFPGALPAWQIVDVVAGTLIVFLPAGWDAPRRFFLEAMLRSPESWDAQADIPHPSGTHFFLLTDGMPTAFTIRPDQHAHYRDAVASLLRYSEQNMTLQVSRPRIEDATYQGFHVRTVAVATEAISRLPIPPARLRPPSWIVVFDLREIFRSFDWRLLYKDTILVQELLTQFGYNKPAGFVVAISGAPIEVAAEGPTFRLTPGLVLRVAYESDSLEGDRDPGSLSPSDTEDRANTQGELEGHDPSATPHHSVVEVDPDRMSDGTRSSNSLLELEDPEVMVSLHFGVLIPGFSLEHLELSLRLPMTTPEVMTQVQENRDTMRALDFPRLIQVECQPDPRWGIFLAAPDWAPECITVCIDLCLGPHQHRVFAALGPPSADRSALLELAGMSPHSNADVYCNDAGPIPADTQVTLHPGSLVSIVEANQPRPWGMTFSAMLSTHLPWDSSRPFPEDDDIDRFCITCAEGFFCFPLIPSRAHLYRDDIAVRIACLPDMLHLAPADPRQNDVSFFGRQCRTVVAVVDRSALAMQQQVVLGILDARRLFKGWIPIATTDGWIALADLHTFLSVELPRGFEVTFRGCDPAQDWVTIDEGRVIVALVRPTFQVEPDNGVAVRVASRTQLPDAASEGPEIYTHTSPDAPTSAQPEQHAPVERRNMVGVLMTNKTSFPGTTAIHDQQVRRPANTYDASILMQSMQLLHLVTHHTKVPTDPCPPDEVIEGSFCSSLAVNASEAIVLDPSVSDTVLHEALWNPTCSAFAVAAATIEVLIQEFPPASFQGPVNLSLEQLVPGPTKWAYCEPLPRTRFSLSLPYGFPHNQPLNLGQLQLGFTFEDVHHLFGQGGRTKKFSCNYSSYDQVVSQVNSCAILTVGAAMYQEGQVKRCDMPLWPNKGSAIPKKAMRMLFIGLHAPHRATEANQLDRWWHDTHIAIAAHSKGDIVILAGDMNASVGSVPSEHVGTLGAEVEDDPGTALHAILRDFSLFLPSTWEDSHFGASHTYCQKRGNKACRPDFIGLPFQWIGSRCTSYLASQRSGDLSTAFNTEYASEWRRQADRSMAAHAVVARWRQHFGSMEGGEELDLDISAVPTEAEIQLALKVAFRGSEPAGCKSGQTIYFYKGRGEHSSCSSYRAILLLPVWSKIIHQSLRPTMKAHFERVAPPLQLGSRAKCSVVYGSHIVRGATRCAVAAGHTHFTLFADIASAFYSVIQSLVAKHEHDSMRLIEEPATDSTMLRTHLEEPTALQADGASKWLEALTSQLQSDNFFMIRGDSVAVATTKGSRPGSSWADLIFATLIRRIMARRNELRANLPRLSHPLRLPWDGQRSLCPCDSTSPLLEIDEVIWADDVAIPRIAEADRVALALGHEASFLTDALQEFGFKVAYGPHKTAGLLSLRGPHSRRAKQAIFGRTGLKGSVPVLLEDLPSVHLPLVETYRHLGSQQAVSGGLRQEIQFRASQARVAFGEARRKVFRNPAITIVKKAYILRSTVLPKHLFGSGSWGPLTLGEFRAFAGVVWTLYRPLLGLKHSDNQSLDASTCFALLNLPSPMVLLRTERLTYLGQMVCSGPDALWAIVRADQAYAQTLQSDIQWLHAWTWNTSGMPCPAYDWPRWRSFMQEFPGRYKGLIKRARALDIYRHGVIAALNGLHRALVIKCGLQDSVASEPAHALAPPFFAAGHRTEGPSTGIRLDISASLLEVLQALDPRDEEAAWAAVEATIEPVAILRDTVSEWRASNQGCPIVESTAENLLLLLDVDLLADSLQPVGPSRAFPEETAPTWALPGRAAFVLSGEVSVFDLQAPPPHLLDPLVPTSLSLGAFARLLYLPPARLQEAAKKSAEAKAHHSLALTNGVGLLSALVRLDALRSPMRPWFNRILESFSEILESGSVAGWNARSLPTALGALCMLCGCSSSKEGGSICITHWWAVTTSLWVLAAQYFRLNPLKADSIEARQFLQALLLLHHFCLVPGVRQERYASLSLLRSLRQFPLPRLEKSPWEREEEGPCADAAEVGESLTVAGFHVEALLYLLSALLE